jgi:hypothetical protein
MDQCPQPEDLGSFMDAYTEAWNSGDLDRIVAAMVTVRWVCHRPNGSIIWDFHDSYLLAFERGQWSILGDVVHG